MKVLNNTENDTKLHSIFIFTINIQYTFLHILVGLCCVHVATMAVHHFIAHAKSVNQKMKTLQNYNVHIIIQKQ
jgi:hypothetical protein